MDHSREEKIMFQIMNDIRDSVKVDEEVLMTITVLINTTEKLQKFKEWIESKTENGELNTTEAEIANIVSRTGKMQNFVLLGKRGIRH